MQHFVDVMENKIKLIDQIYDESLNKVVSQNREKLVSIAMIVLICDSQLLPFRGHKDDAPYYETEDCSNFQAPLDLKADGGDKALQDHATYAPRYATYRSRTIQNELV